MVRRLSSNANRADARSEACSIDATASADDELGVEVPEPGCVFDRLLARLLVVAPNRWLLKGAVALDFRYGAKS